LQVGEVAGGGVGPGGDDAWVDVRAAAFVVQPGAEQVAEQTEEAGDLAAPVDLRDQLVLPVFVVAVLVVAVLVGAGRWA
jgi:hypothetical protein